MIVFDFDGTLFKIHPLSYDDNGKFCVDRFRIHQHLAEEVPALVALYRMYEAQGTNVVIITARPETMRDMTLAKLESIGIVPKCLYMRNEKENNLKFKLHVLDVLRQSEKIDLIFEDRQDMVDAMTAAGHYAVKVP